MSCFPASRRELQAPSLKMQPHVLLVSFPAQGHINPALRLAKRLLDLPGGLRVTFATSIGGDRHMARTGTPEGLSFATFSDGYDDGFKPGDDRDHQMSELKRRGSETLSELIAANARSDQPFTFLVYCTLLPWAAKVARKHNLPSILFWNQPAAVLDVYYYYFNGFGDYIKNHVDDLNFCLKLPGLPLLSRLDLPYFFIHTNIYPFALPLFKEHLEVLDEESNPKVLVNTFDAIEHEALNSIDKYKLIGVGPLIPYDTSFGGDLFRGSISKDYMRWLDSKPESSVIYISFGSISMLSEPQIEQMERALLDVGRPFLWVMRKNGKEEEIEEDDDDDHCMSSCNRDELEKQGMIVPWCCQVDVLSHPSIACFLTHCGWNSTLESLAFGVPVVAFPQWADQLTITKLVEDVWKMGVRLRTNSEGLAESAEIKRCLELVMADGGGQDNEMRRNAKNWKSLTMEAAKDGSSSELNLRAFANEILEIEV
uniref:Glycosyltransferase n=1 Tax=Rhizophora mucronata TaxID=61149 RepID=A0A2P2J9U0_RHIMU